MRNTASTLPFAPHAMYCKKQLKVENVETGCNQIADGRLLTSPLNKRDI